MSAGNGQVNFASNFKTMSRSILNIAAMALLSMAMPSFAKADPEPAAKKKILIVASNGATSKQTGWPIGAWYAEVSHPYWEFTQAGYEVEFASPNGGEIAFDPYSDPEHESKLAGNDLVSLGFKKNPQAFALTQHTQPVSDINPATYDALFIIGGLGPMQTMYKNARVERLVREFYVANKPVGIVCHATALLLTTKLPNGKLLVAGKKWTGYSNQEEDILDNNVKMKVNAFRIEDEAKKIENTSFVTAPPFTPFVVKDGNLITGQQQSSGGEAARAVLSTLMAKK